MQRTDRADVDGDHPFPPMTRVLVRCDNCGAEQSLPAFGITMTVDLTTDECAAVYGCPLCGADSERGGLNVKAQAVLLDAGVQLAARGV